MNKDEKKCPDCAEIIKVDAKVCRHCGHKVTDIDIVKAIGANKPKPYGGCIVAILLLLGVAYCTSKNSDGSKSTSAPEPANVTGSDGATINQMVEDGKAHERETASKWTYSSSKDDMRGTTTRYAEVESTNAAEMDFPYNGGVFGHIQIRQRPKDGLQIMFTVDKGQILCSDYGSNALHIKFDAGTVGRYSCSNANDGTSTVAFLDAGRSTVLAKLKHSNVVKVEADMYDNGSQQWAFDTHGLVWK